MNFNYVYVAATLLLTVYGQIIIKWQVGKAGALPGGTGERMSFLLNLLLNPWVLSSFAAAFLAAVSWMAAMTKFQLSAAYPFMALSFGLVLIFSGVFFDEPLTTAKIAGVLLVMAGIVVSSAF